MTHEQLVTELAALRAENAELRALITRLRAPSPAAVEAHHQLMVALCRR